MNSKQRLTISIIALSFVALVGIIFSLTWVLFLRYTTFTNVNGKFLANKVMGEVNANVFFAGEIQNMTTNGDPQGATKLVFNGTEVNDTRWLSVPGDRVFQLTERFDSLVLEYRFANTSLEEDWLVSLNSNFANLENVTVTSAYFEEAGITDFRMITEPYNDEYIKSVPVHTNGVLFVYIKISRLDGIGHSDFEANMNWTLNSREFQYGN